MPAGPYRVVTALAVVLLLAGLVPVLCNDDLSGAVELAASPVSLQDAEESPSVQLTYYSNSNLTPAPVQSGAKLAGDHIVLMSTWTPAQSVQRSRIEVEAPALATTISRESPSSSVEIDTRVLNNNATCIVNMTAWLVNGSTVDFQISNVYLGNFFTPEVTVVSPNGGEVYAGVCIINWTAFDKNADEELTFELLVSADEGVNFQLVAANLNVTSYEWNCTGFFLLDTYVIQVWASDGIYMTSDTSDEPFTAGTVPITSTTTSTTIAPFDLTAAFLGVTVIVSGTMAIVVYFAAKRWL